jgi:hypothetical protein
MTEETPVARHRNRDQPRFLLPENPLNTVSDGFQAKTKK